MAASATLQSKKTKNANQNKTNLKNAWVRMTIPAPAAVTQRNQPEVLVTIEDLVDGEQGNPKLPTDNRLLLNLKKRAIKQRRSPITLKSFQGIRGTPQMKKVLPMSPERNVTRVSIRTAIVEALVAEADYIVTGDGDLLAFDPFEHDSHRHSSWASRISIRLNLSSEHGCQSDRFSKENVFLVPAFPRNQRNQQVQKRSCQKCWLFRFYNKYCVNNNTACLQLAQAGQPISRRSQSAAYSARARCPENPDQQTNTPSKTKNENASQTDITRYNAKKNQKWLHKANKNKKMTFSAMLFTFIIHRIYNA